MLRYLFARLWKNPLARTGMVAATLLISFALIFLARQSLYNFFTRLFTSPDWSDVTRHSSRPFAFEENENKAQQLTAEAWRAIYELAEKKTGDNDQRGDVLTAPVGRRPFSAFLRRHAEEEIFTLFNSLAAACGSLYMSLDLSDRASALGEVAESSTPAGRARRGQRETMRNLLRIYATGTEAALQKKPDYLPAIELSEEIFRASCGMREAAVLYSRALDYREYRLQKQLYDSDGGKLYQRNPEEFHARAHEAYARDAIYRDLLARHFASTRFRTPYNPAQLINLRNAYLQLKSAATVKALTQGLLAEARHSNADVARKCHYEIFSLDYPGIASDAQYVYALAETAFRGGEFVRAQNVIMNALKSGLTGDTSLRRDLERLNFHLELQLHESENLSRF